MYRLAISLALIALFAAGCGGSGGESDPSPGVVAEASGSVRSGADASRTDSAEGAGRKKKADDAAEKPSDADTDADAEGAPSASDGQEEAPAKVPVDKRSVLTESVVRSALLRFGLTAVRVEVRRHGRAVTAVVARRGACNFVASQEANILVTIQDGAPRVKSARFEVAGTGEELGYYVLGCKRPEIPSGAGRVVLDHAGVGGPYKSKRFTIRSKRWALEWLNEAASLAVIVEAVGGESKGGYFKPVGSQKAESGRYDYRGRGTFEITAYGAGGWRLRVKEIR